MSFPLVIAAAVSHPRAICNLILDEADASGQRITNLALQKLLYFAHGQYLVDTQTPLVDGVFEAWQFGPVHPTAYHAFKKAGANPIDFRAVLQDHFTREITPVPSCDDPDVTAHVRRILRSYAQQSAGRLVEVSHAKNAPWHITMNRARTQTIIGLRIYNDLILTNFKFHKVSVGLEPRYGEPREEARFIKH